MSTGLKGPNIGMVSGKIEDNPFVAFLNTYMAKSFSDKDCRTTWFCLRPEACGKAYNSIDKIDHLRHMVLSGKLDGIISLELLDAEAENFLQQHNTPLVYAGNYVPEQNHICIDYAHIFSQSFAHAAAAGFVRPAVVVQAHGDWMEKACLQEMPKFFPSNRYFPPENCRANCRQWAESKEKETWRNNLISGWLALRETERPDILMIPDDILALQIGLELLARGKWMPWMLVMRNKDIALPGFNNLPGFSDRVFGEWVLDIKKFADFVVTNFTNILRTGTQAKSLPFLGFRPEYRFVNKFNPN
jgi:DNA-binding LacI/PurR family transcriptional regulator